MSDHFEHDDRFDQLSGSSDWQLVDEDQDIRGCELLAPDGTRIGEIDDMLIDEEQEKVIAFRLDDGRAGAVSQLEIGDDKVIYHPATPERRGQVAYFLVRRD